MGVARLQLLCIGSLLALAAVQGYAVFLMWPQMLPGQWSMPAWPWHAIGVLALELTVSAVWLVRWAKKHQPRKH